MFKKQVKMKTINLTYSYKNFIINFEDNEFGVLFNEVFKTKRIFYNKSSETLYVRGNQNCGYTLYKKDQFIMRLNSREETVNCIAKVIGRDFCSCVNASLFVMHASCVCINGKIIAFSGASGSGKTTLSLFFSEYGHYVGDEYAFLDIDKGFMWTEEHPFQVKKSNETVLQRIDDKYKIKTECVPFGEAYYISLDSINYSPVGSIDKIPLKVIVYPHFDISCKNASINRLPAGKIPKLVLESLMGEQTPSVILNAFIHMIQVHKIPLFELIYSNSATAVDLLYETISL